MAAVRLFVLPAVTVVLVVAAASAQQRPLFDLRSGFWTNLHHYLHALTRSSGPLAEQLPQDTTAAEREDWSKALVTYRAEFGKRSLLFDAQLVGARSALRTADAQTSLEGVALPAAMRAALEAAAPIYRKHLWPAHDAANRRYLDAITPLLRQHGQQIAGRLAATFDQAWPEQPIQVDIVHDAGPPGNAYTISEPTLIAIAANDPRHQGLAALEVVFHEASHRWDEILMREVGTIAKELGRPVPGQLWHGLLFFNAGRITVEALAAAGVRDYTMYMEQEKMFDRVYAGWREPILKHWPAFLMKEISRQEAIRRILLDRK